MRACLQDLREGLQSLIAGEMVDYTWEAEDGKKERLETTKRASIKALPKHLIVHLKRFEYYFDTAQKLNDRFEFPRQLDMYVGTASACTEAELPQVVVAGLSFSFRYCVVQV